MWYIAEGKSLETSDEKLERKLLHGTILLSKVRLWRCVSKQVYGVVTYHQAKMFELESSALLELSRRVIAG